VEDLAAARRVRDFGMKEQAVDRLLVVLDSGHRRIGARRGDMELRRRLIHPVPVARPHDRRRFRLKPRKKSVVVAHRDFGAAVFALRRRHDLRPGELGDELHAVADPEDRRAHVEHPPIDRGRALIEHGIRAAGQDDSLGIERANEVEVEALRRGVDLAVHARLADSPGDQLREL
jgi:hypothetical protein